MQWGSSPQTLRIGGAGCQIGSAQTLRYLEAGAIALKASGFRAARRSEPGFRSRESGLESESTGIMTIQDKESESESPGIMARARRQDNESDSESPGILCMLCVLGRRFMSFYFIVI